MAALTNIQAVQLPLQELSSHHRMHINYYPVTFTLWNNYCPWLRLRSRSTSFWSLINLALTVRFLVFLSNHRNVSPVRENEQRCLVRWCVFTITNTIFQYQSLVLDVFRLLQPLYSVNTLRPDVHLFRPPDVHIRSFIKRKSVKDPIYWAINNIIISVY